MTSSKEASRFNPASPAWPPSPASEAQREAARRRRWRRLVQRIALALAIGLFLALAPTPVSLSGWLVPAQVPLAIFLIVILIGKALYDTFFWDRYPR